MEKKQIIYTSSLTGTIGEQLEEKDESEQVEFGQQYIPIQQMWEVNPVDTGEYDGIIGYKEN
ncbi:hypothetical protein [Bacillus sp. PS06]|uniref:hypothetical protein n=1 Tax=Bacillus sp. PS06 TaxID=2764176 RepID=UPI00177BA19A|nr:hypothetical protein [Bacillus sp. PS06]MBD8070787.1 hypothetical protein [Bacillus sp. PS06]